MQKLSDKKAALLAAVQALRESDPAEIVVAAPEKEHRTDGVEVQIARETQSEDRRGGHAGQPRPAARVVGHRAQQLDHDHAEAERGDREVESLDAQAGDAEDDSHQGGDAAAVAMSARIAATDAAVHAADESIQIHGGFGYTVEYHVERHYRDAKTIEVLDGGNETLKDRLADYSRVFRIRVLAGALIRAADYIAAQRRRTDLIAAMVRRMELDPSSMVRDAAGLVLVLPKPSDQPAIDALLKLFQHPRGETRASAAGTAGTGPCCLAAP